MTLDQLRANLRARLKAAQSKEQYFASLVRREGTTRMTTSANQTEWAKAKARIEVYAAVLRDLNCVTA